MTINNTKTSMTDRISFQKTGNRKSTHFQKLLKERSNIVTAVLMVIVLLNFGQNITAQDVEHTKSSPDQSLRSNARINPSTLAMEFSISLSDLPGRGGASMPFVFNYSSKVWRVRAGGSYNTNGIRWTVADPLYADDSVSGWTSTYGVPTMVYAFDDDEFYDCQANPVGSSAEWGTPECGLYYVKRVRITLPDGSTHELRKDDGVYPFDSINPSIDRNGTFLAVDGSRMRLEMANNDSTLYLPDGSRYHFADNHKAEKFMDKHGNVLTYNSISNGWTDTLGKTLSNPFPAIVPENYSPNEGTQNVNVPNLGAGTRQYQLVWKKLSNGALASGETLSYDSYTCSTTGSLIPRMPSLYDSNGNVKLCSNRAGYFDPAVLTEIVLPDGSKYKFQYTSFGEIVRIDYPTGGYEKFVYDKIAPLSSTQKQVYDQTNRGVVSRIVGAGDGTIEYTWTYQAGYVGTVIDESPYYVTTTAPDGTKTKQFLHRNQADRKNYGFDNPLTGREMETQEIDALGNIRSRRLTEWETTQGVSPGFAAYPKRDIRVKRVFNIVNDPATNTSLIGLTENEYDTSGSFDAAQFASLNLKRSKTYHYKVPATAVSTGDVTTALGIFSGATPAVINENVYLYDVNYRNRGIVGLIAETRIKDGAENVRAKSQTTYDESVYLEAASISNAPGWENPNSNNYRGLPTTTRSWYNIANNQYIETHASFDQFGNPRKSWDGRGNYTETQYTDNYTDNTNRNSFALPTKTISYSGANGTGTMFETSVKYDFNTGLVRYTTDINNQVSEIEYNDALLRPTKAVAPNGQQTFTEYGVPSSGQLSASQRFVKVKTQIDTNSWKESYTWFDGLARTVKTQSVDPNGDIFALICYDQYGRQSKTSNPFRSVSSAGCSTTNLEWTTTTYNVAGKAWKVTTPDNAVAETNYSLATDGNNLGTVVTVKDPANKEKRSITNALGQLVRVDEPTDTGGLGTISNPNQPTNYKYNTLGKMIEVTQGVQQRYFLYDSLGRMLRVRQPEQQINSSLNLSNSETANAQWTVGFSYDSTGNILTVTDAKNVITSNTYDALNRVLTRSYSDGITPIVNFTYDDPSVPFSKGKLTKINSIISETKYIIYDKMGRLAASEQRTPFGSETISQATPRTSEYKYNLAGILTEQTYPSGRIVKNFLAANGDLSTISSKMSNGQFKTYASNFAYTASGIIKHLQIGNGLWESAKMNSREQVTELNLGFSSTDGSLLKLNYDYGTMDVNGTVDATKNAGNIAKQTVNFAGLAQPFMQTYKYDSLNRITEAKEMSGTNQTWIQNWGYDRYGNRTAFSQNILGQQMAINNQTLPSVDQNTNRIQTGQSYQYDANGNLIADATGRQYTFDGDNKQVLVKDSSNNDIGRYYYDGNGKRVKKVTTSETTIFIYDGSGKLVAEYSTTAQIQNPTISYTATDPIGSPRVLTNKQGQIISRRDFMPFGEEIAPDGIYRTANMKYGATDNVRQKFTGYQRDEETNLDFAEARYYNNNHGRFTAVDPLLASGKSANPQTFNRYIYTMNRPLIFTDSTGLQTGSPKKSVTVEASDVKPTVKPVNSSFDTTLKTNANERVRVYYSPEVQKKLNDLQTRIETLTVSQRENYQAATEYGAAAMNQADSSSIGMEVACFIANPVIGAAASIYGETPQSAAFWYTDDQGMLNMPGTTNNSQIGGGIAPQGVGPTAGVGTEQSFPLGDAASTFQNAANNDQMAIDQLSTDGAATRFAQENSGSPNVIVRRLDANGNPTGLPIRVSNTEEILKKEYQNAITNGRNAAANNPYQR